LNSSILYEDFLSVNNITSELYVRRAFDREIDDLVELSAYVSISPLSSSTSTSVVSKPVLTRCTALVTVRDTNDVGPWILSQHKPSKKYSEIEHKGVKVYTLDYIPVYSNEINNLLLSKIDCDYLFPTYFIIE